MKKLLSVILILLLMFVVCSCTPTCNHKWNNATCYSPKKCSLCGEIEGVALAHNYTSATCTAPKECTRCKTHSGSVLGHSYSKGYFTRCNQKDPSYISRDSVFPCTPELSFSMNSAGGIELYWNHKYVGSKNENFFYGHCKILCNLVCQQNRRIIPPVLQRTDGLPGYAHFFCKFFLPDVSCLPDFLNSVFQSIPPFM